jgi:hypothetical protein
MKKPTLRLRQVFEGPTHFKVVRPLGNPIKIAKKGLSPNLMGRLRKFARGPEVPDATEQDEQNLADLEAEALDQPRRRRPGEPGRRYRPFESGEIEVTGSPVDEIEVTGEPAEEVVTRRYRPGDAVLPPRPRPFEADAVPPPILAEAIDIATRERPRPSRPMTLEEIAGLPVDEAVAVDGLDALTASVATEEMPFTSRGQIATGEELVVPARVTKPAAMPAPMKQIEPVAATRPRPRGFGVAAPEEAVEAAPALVQRGQVTGRPKPRRDAVGVAAEAEPTEAAAAEKPAPVEPGPFEKTLGNLGYTMAQYEAMPAPMKVAAQQAVRATIAAQTAADAEAKAAEAETDAFAEQQKALEIEADSLQASAKKARETQQKILDEYDYLKNPTSYFGSMSTLNQIGTAISLAAGAFASGMTGMPNFAQKIYDNAIEQDLQAQKRKADSLYQRLVQTGNSVNSAEDLVKAQLKLVGAAELSRRSAQIKLPLVKAQIDAKAASEALKATETLGRVAKDQASMAREAELRPYQVRKLKAETAIAEGTPARLKEEMRLRREKADREREEAEQKREDRLEKAQTDADEKRIARELTLGDATLELKTDARAPLIRQGISQRAQALESLLKLENLLTKAKDGYELWKPGSDTRNQAIAELNFAIENFPKGAGFGRAISVSAKELISKALQEPNSYKTLFKEIFVGKDPSIGVKTLRQEVARNFEEEIASQVSSKFDRQAIRGALDSWYKTANEKIKREEAQSVADEEL